MTDAQKLATLLPAVRDLIAEAHKLGGSPAEIRVQAHAAWIGELLGTGPHGIDRTSIVECVSTEDVLDHAENAARDFDKADLESAQMDAATL